MSKIITATAATIVVAGALICVLGQTDRNPVNLEGVWRTAVTPRNCANGNPVAPEFPGILLFAQGGTMTGTSTAASSVYGIWRRDGGAREFTFATVSLKYDAAGTLIGSRRITQSVTLDSGGNTFTSTGGFQDYDLSGNPTITGCSTSVGTRFE
jgi:hypothetical protein